MTDHPILFSGEMVRALLAGRKTQTRRVINPQLANDARLDSIRFDGAEVGFSTKEKVLPLIRCPFGAPGDRLWVRETWQKYSGTDCVQYRADGEQALTGWRPSIFMPRWASRITLEVVSVRVERVQDISDDDISAEGVRVPAVPVLYRSFEDAAAGKAAQPLGARDLFCALWDGINGKRAPWASNPWVWRLEVKRVMA